MPKSINFKNIQNIQTEITITSKFKRNITAHGKENNIVCDN